MYMYIVLSLIILYFFLLIKQIIIILYYYYYCHSFVQLLDEFFRRAGENAQTNFLQVKGFNLLALQLKQHTISYELMSALFSIVLGQEINLQSDS